MDPYSCIPSAGKIVDYPISCCMGVLDNHKESTFKKVACFATGMIYYPISIAVTPLAILADAVSGIAQAIFVIIRGFTVVVRVSQTVSESRDVRFTAGAAILGKKVFVTSIQQTIACALRIILIPTIFLWPISYIISKKIISNLPNRLNYNTINAFIEDAYSYNPDSRYEPSDDHTLPPQSIPSCAKKSSDRRASLDPNRYKSYYDEEHKNCRPMDPPEWPNFDNKEQYEKDKAVLENARNSGASKPIIDAILASIDISKGDQLEAKLTSLRALYDVGKLITSNYDKLRETYKIFKEVKQRISARRASKAAVPIV